MALALKINEKFALKKVNHIAGSHNVCLDV